VKRFLHWSLSYRLALLTTPLFLLLFVLQAAAQSASGDISPYSLEIDPSANLYPSGTPGFVDWVRDSLPNTDPASLVNSIATGIIPNLTGAPGGTGHWNGVRIVDGIDGGDRDIFLTGGKENDLSTWNIGKGTVGSSKYDITQAYLANNQQSLYFGMERRGNNGTTAFDFEFNQLAPNPATPLLPTRSIGDVLFTFEMSGSGSSGSAVPHYFVWNGAKYIERIPPPPSLVSSINNVDTPAAPWGYVNSKGAWVLGTIPRFEFAEASVSLADAFPNFTPCNNRAFVQVRTRSSASDTSDLKDTTHIFEFLFGGPEAVPSFAINCAAQFSYDGTQSTDSMSGHNVAYSWDFTPPAGVTLAGAGLTGPDSGGTYHSTSASGVVNVGLSAGVDSATIAARLTVIEGTACTDSSDVVSVTVLRPLSAAITQKLMDGNTLTVTLTGSAPGATALQWQRLNSSGVWVDIAGANGSAFTYSSFEADSAPTVQNFNINGEAYQGKLFQVQIRLHAFRVIGGLTCEAFSPPLTVKKVIAVDP
jgi:hypothetical protein